MSDKATKDIVYNLLNDGIKLSEIQQILKSDHDVTMTFLDLRLLAAEFEDVDWKKLDPEIKVVEDKDEKTPEPGDGRTTIDISKLVRPGSVANGSVKFGSGATADWMLSQQGQLSLDNNVGEPTPEDIQDFQTELQEQLSQSRY